MKELVPAAGRCRCGVLRRRSALRKPHTSFTFPHGRPWSGKPMGTRHAGYRDPGVGCRRRGSGCGDQLLRDIWGRDWQLAPMFHQCISVLDPRMTWRRSSGLIEAVVMVRCQTAQRDDVDVTLNWTSMYIIQVGDPGAAPRCHQRLHRRRGQGHGWIGMHNDAVRRHGRTGSPSKPSGISWLLWCCLGLKGDQD